MVIARTFHCRRVNGRAAQAVSVMTAALALTGCATTVTTVQGQRLRTTSPEFRSYAEEVFRAHNEVATSLAYAPCFAKRGGNRNEPGHSLTYRGGSGYAGPQV